MNLKIRSTASFMTTPFCTAGLVTEFSAGHFALELLVKYPRGFFTLQHALMCGEMSGRVDIMKLTCRMNDSRLALKDSRGTKESEQSATTDLL